MAHTATAGQFNPIEGMEARMFGADLIAAGGAQALRMAAGEVRHILSLDDSAPGQYGRALFLKAAMSAGALAGKAGFTDALAALVLSDGIADDERTEIGYAVHSLVRAKQSGLTAGGLKDRVQTELAGYADAGGSDTVRLAVAAFAVGATIEDPAAANELQSEFSEMVIDRTEG